MRGRVLCAALWAVMGSADAQSAPLWTWSGTEADARTITIDLVRGEVSIEQVAGPTRIVAETVAPAARIEAIERDRAVQIRDRYPGRPAGWAVAECLPPVDARGDYWTYPAKFMVHVRLAAGQALKVRLLQGDVRLAAGLTGVDAATADGRLLRQ